VTPRAQGLDRAPAGSKPARRPKFDKDSSTTWLLAALIGLGAGATWQLLQAPPRPVQVAAAAPVVVVDTSGRVLGVYSDQEFISAAADRRAATVTLASGRSRSASASTRGS